MPEEPKPDAPARVGPSEDWDHLQLHKDVIEAIKSLPSTFSAETTVSGVLATDVFTLNTPFGAMIEEQVVESLNRARQAWDKDGAYSHFTFVRQAQKFPDVLLKKPGSDGDILFGIELKGWYLLAKEREPSFRFTATPVACAPADLIVVVPWVLSNVIAGSPRIFPPFVEHARYAAEYRNYYWEHVRDSADGKVITLAQGVAPYPAKSDQISDKPAADSGGNFGRLARTGLLDDYMKTLDDQLLRGIPAKHWRSFFKSFQDQAADSSTEELLQKLAEKVRKELETAPSNRLKAVARILEDLQIVAFE